MNFSFGSVNISLLSVVAADQNTLAKIRCNANIWWYRKNIIKNL